MHVNECISVFIGIKQITHKCSCQSMNAIIFREFSYLFWCLDRSPSSTERFLPKWHSHWWRQSDALPLSWPGDRLGRRRTPQDTAETAGRRRLSYNEILWTLNHAYIRIHFLYITLCDKKNKNLKIVYILARFDLEQSFKEL